MEGCCGLITNITVFFQQQQAGLLAAQTTTGAACDVLFQQIGESFPWLRPEAEEPGWEKQDRGGAQALGQPASLLVAWNTDACMSSPCLEGVKSALSSPVILMALGAHSVLGFPLKVFNLS